MADCFQTAQRVLFIACVFGTFAAQGGTVLFQDNFNQQGTTLNQTNWTSVGGNTLGRTELTPWQNNGGGQFLVNSNGANLEVDTYNNFDTTHATLLGTQADTFQTFEPTDNNNQVIFSTSLQLTSVQQGLVYGMYMYGTGNSNTDDEIDIELVTNYLQTGSQMQVELNRFSAGSPDTGDGGLVNLPVGFNPLALNTWTVVWNPNYIDYYVDGTLLQQVTTKIPTGPMSVNVNAFAPNSNWGLAYNASLQPAVTAGANQKFDAYLTNITVTSSETPEPTTWLMMFTGLAAMIWVRKRQIV